VPNLNELLNNPTVIATGSIALRILGVLLLLLVMWIIASIVKGAIVRGGRGARIDERTGTSLTNTLGSAGYWFVWLLALPIVLRLLGLDGLLGPVQSLLNQILGFLPQLIAGLIILAIGVFVARLLRRIVTNLLFTAADQPATKRLGLSSTLREGGLANLAGIAVFALIMLPVLAMVVQSFGLTGILTPIQNLINQILGYAPQLLGGIIILAIGLIVARVVRQVLTSLLTAAGSERLALRLGMTNSFGESGLAGFIGTIVFVLIMLPVLTSALQSFGLTGVMAPVQNVLNQLLGYLPQLLGALLILIIGIFVARFVRQIVGNVLRSAGSEKLAEKMGMSQALGDGGLAGLAGTIVFVMILLPIVASALQSLGLTGVLTPVQNLIDQVLGFIPKIIATILILAIGYFLARLVRQIVGNVLTALGSEKLAASLGLGNMLGINGLAGFVSGAVFVFMMIAVITAALQPLNIESVTRPISTLFNTLLALLPRIIAGIALLVVAWVVARAVRQVVQNLASKQLNNLSEGIKLQRPQMLKPQSLPEVLGTLVVIGIMLLAAIQAAEIVGFGSLSRIITSMGSVAAQVLSGLLVFAIGLFLANFVANMVDNSAIPNARALSTISRIAIILLSVAMALRQMGVANDIVNLAFGGMIAGLGIAIAIAFGWGGRNAAGRLVDSLVNNLEEKSE
jgi:hypothetical protein